MSCRYIEVIPIEIGDESLSSNLDGMAHQWGAKGARAFARRMNSMRSPNGIILADSWRPGLACCEYDARPMLGRDSSGADTERQ